MNFNAIKKVCWLLGLLLFFVGCETQNNAPKQTAIAQDTTKNTPQITTTEGVAAVNRGDTTTAAPTKAGVTAATNCALLENWFSMPCEGEYTKFVCNGKEPFIIENAADEEWCTGVGNLLVKVLFRHAFTEQGQEKVLLLVGMVPENRQNDLRLQETLLGISVWKKNQEGWEIESQNKMLSFLNTNIKQPIKCSFFEPQPNSKGVAIAYTRTANEGDAKDLLLLGWVKSGFMPMGILPLSATNERTCKDTKKSLCPCFAYTGTWATKPNAAGRWHTIQVTTNGTINSETNKGCQAVPHDKTTVYRWQGSEYNLAN